MESVARWWDGVELWTTGLPLGVQVVLVLLVVAPICALASLGLDSLIGAVSALWSKAPAGRDEHAQRSED